VPTALWAQSAGDGHAIESSRETRTSLIRSKILHLCEARIAFGARLFAITVLTGAAMHAAAADDADQVANGHQLALEICSACHIAAPDQRTRPILTEPPPSLETLANKPGATAESVQKFLLTIHLSLANGKDMPNPEVTEDQARDLAAYVMSLRKAKP
jgi:mono/diheme cytochrome c family protein